LFLNEFNQLGKTKEIIPDHEREKINSSYMRLKEKRKEKRENKGVKKKRLLQKN
jgi:hypothetical protein